MVDRRQNAGTTNIAQWRPVTGGSAGAPRDAKPWKYDIRVVDQFYDYCQAIACTDRHRDEAHARLRNGLKRSIWSILVASSFLFYYVMDRAAQAMALF